MARYLYGHPGQAFCRGCLTELLANDAAVGASAAASRSTACREFEGTCFKCRRLRRVVGFYLAETADPSGL